MKKIKGKIHNLHTAAAGWSEAKFFFFLKKNKKTKINKNAKDFFPHKNKMERFALLEADDCKRFL